MFGRPPRPRSSEPGRDFYAILGVSKDATEGQLKKAYLKLARKHHPDRNRGNEAEATEKFKEVQEVYGVLSDPEKRQIYDRYGEEGLKEGRGGPGGGGMPDIFKAFFGGEERDSGKGEDIAFKLTVELADLYNGSAKEIPISKNVVCSGCDGEGSSVKGGRKVCKHCDGEGSRVELRQMGPFVSQAEVVCRACAGRGESIREEDKCKKCNAKKVVAEKKVLVANIEKGMKSGDRITFHGEASQVPGQIPGDIIIVVEEKEDETAAFTRKGDDLFMTRSIALSEALCGFKFDFEHMDGRTVVVQSQEGDVIKPGDKKVIVGEGMPLKGNPQEKGNLIVQFSIIFPEPHDISHSAREALLKMLPERVAWTPPDGVKEAELFEYTCVDYVYRESHSRSEAYDSDEDHRGHAHRGGGGQCQFM